MEENIILDLGLFLLAGLFALRAAFALLGAFFFNKGDQNIAKRKFTIFFVSFFLGCGTFLGWIKLVL